MIQRIGHITTDFRPPVGGAEAYIADLIEQLRPIVKEQVVFQLDNSEKDPSLRDDPSIVLVPRAPGRWKWSRAHNLYWFNWQLRRKRFYRVLKNCDVVIVNYPFHWLPVTWHPRVIALSHCVEWVQPPEKWTHRHRLHIAKRCHEKVAGLVANDTNFYREMGLDVPPKTHLWSTVAPRRWCLPNCVDPAMFSVDDEASIPDDLSALLTLPTGKTRPFILLARNASPHRGIHLAIEALGRIASDLPDIALVVAGGRAKPDYQAKLDRVAKEWNVTDRVFHIGHVPREKMSGLNRAAAMALVPTIAHEGTSLSALEAMACGTATVTSDHGGLADLPGVLAKPNGESLAKALLDTWPRRDEIAQQQREEVLRDYNIARWGEIWREIVMEIAKI